MCLTIKARLPGKHQHSCHCVPAQVVQDLVWPHTRLLPASFWGLVFPVIFPLSLLSDCRASLTNTHAHSFFLSLSPSLILLHIHTHTTAGKHRIQQMSFMFAARPPFLVCLHQLNKQERCSLFSLIYQPLTLPLPCPYPPSTHSHLPPSSPHCWPPPISCCCQVVLV